MENQQLKIQIERSKIESIKSEITQIQLKQKLADSEKKLLDAKIYEAQIRANALNDKIKKMQEKGKDINKTIAEKHELNGKWGFDPESGQIIEEEANG